MKLDSDVRYLKGVGEKRAALLYRLEIFTVGDLIRYYPRTYEDWSNPLAIDEAPLDTPCCVRGIVDHNPTAQLIRKGMTIYSTRVTDGRSVMRVTIFNSKYAAEKLAEGEEYLFFGKISGNNYYREMTSPEIRPVNAGQKIRPIYSQTASLTTNAIEKLVAGGRGAGSGRERDRGDSARIYHKRTGTNAS